MTKQSNRRRFLTALGTGSLAVAAGCTDQLPGGGEANGNENGATESEAVPEDENGDNGDATPPAISHGELVSDFDEDIDEWFALNGEVESDDEVFLTGSQTVRIENSGEAAGIARSFADGLDIEGHHLSLAVRVDNPRPARVTVRLLAPGQADQIWSTRTILSPYEGWLRMDVGYTGQRGEPFFDDIQEVQITLEDPNASQDEPDEDEEEPADEPDDAEDEAAEDESGDADGDDDGDAIDDTVEEMFEDNDNLLSLEAKPFLQVENEDDSDDDNEEEADEDNGEIQFWVDDLRMTPAADQGYVMLTFDDNVESQYENAFPIFEERDMQGVLCVIPPTLNRPERLDIDHLREMRDAGWDISAHAERSDGLADMDPEEAQEALQSDHEYLDNRGFPDGARFHTVPYHNVNQEVVDIAREHYEMNSYFGGTPNAIPFTDPMHLSRVNMHDLDGFTSLIDTAEEHNQLAIGLAHGVVPEDEVEDDGLADMTTEQLEELLDYIEDSDVQLVTASDLIDNQDDL